MARTERRPAAGDADNYGAIGRFLRSPTEAVDLALFCERFHVRRITVRLGGLAAAAGEPALIGRLRGAFGEVLMKTTSREAAAGQPCPWNPPSAYEPLFRKQGRMTPGTDFPSPWVIAVHPRRGDLYITLTLFGAACEWAAAGAEALVDVAANRIDWRAAAKVFVPEIAVTDRRMDAVALDTGPIAAGVDMEFLSPLVVSSGNPKDDPVPAFSTLGLRLEGLARWHGLTLASVDWGAMRTALRAAEWTWAETETDRWDRGSRRQDRWIAMTGVRGLLHVAANADVMARIDPLLRLGAVTHVGADVAFGCGRYRIVRN